MSEAMGLQEGMSVLDLYLWALGQMLLWPAWRGEKGRVVGVESSPLIAAVTGHGLQHFLPGKLSPLWGYAPYRSG